MKYPPNVIQNWYPRLTLNEKGVPVSQHIVCPVQFIYPVVTERWQPLEARYLQLFYG